MIWGLNDNQGLRRNHHDRGRLDRSPRFDMSRRYTLLGTLIHFARKVYRDSSWLTIAHLTKWTTIWRRYFIYRIHLGQRFGAAR